MKQFLLIAALLVPGGASAIDVFSTIEQGAPPVATSTPMIVDVLAEPGSCWVHPLADPVACYQVRMPEGSVEHHFIDGFTGAGPARLHVNRLTYDWTQLTASHPVVPGLELIERLD